MKKRMKGYLGKIDKILAEDAPETDYEELSREQLVQIGFFMHERLVHLLVTLTFSVLTFAVFFLLLFQFFPALLLLFILLLVLLVPYIMHYYMLENGVQRLYGQYDEMKRRINKGGKEIDHSL
ncbi:MAG TPA: hypothetical protein PLU43_00245 [Lachnospiraceae bacterium]|nr:hypothetical protein [Lachnospiraceae bacterium]